MYDMIRCFGLGADVILALYSKVLLGLSLIHVSFELL